MTERELFLAVMNYGSFDRMPVYHWTCWPELLEVWAEQGVPKDAVEQARHFGVFPLLRRPPVKIQLLPGFDEEVLEETDEYRVLRDSSGVVMKDWKDRSCIPQYLEHTLKDRATWEEHFKPRLQPSADRLPESVWTFVDEYRDRDVPVAISCGSMVGWTRNWAGVEGLAYMAADDPDLIGEIADTIATVVISTIEPVVAMMRPKPEIAWFWEDICCKSGPLVSPRVFERYCVPAYRRITDMLRRYGVNLALVDSDGVIDALAALWLEAGVNVMFPVEIGVWDADPAAFRKAYGKDLRIFGGIDKRVLCQGREAIDAEIKKRLPLMKEGGFVPLPDHLITPGVSVDDYRYYLDSIASLRF